MFFFLLSYFSVVVITYMTKGRNGLFDSQLQVQCTMVGKSRQLKLKAAPCIHSRQEESREGFLFSSLSPFNTVQDPTTGNGTEGLPTSMNIIRRIPKARAGGKTPMAPTQVGAGHSHASLGPQGPSWWEDSHRSAVQIRWLPT